MKRVEETINGSTYSVELLPAETYLSSFHEIHAYVGRFVAAVGRVLGEVDAKDLASILPAEGEDFSFVSVDVGSIGAISGQLALSLGELMADPGFMSLVGNMLDSLTWWPKRGDAGAVLVKNRRHHWHEHIADYHQVVWFALRANFGKVFTGNPGISALMAKARVKVAASKTSQPPQT